MNGLAGLGTLTPETSCNGSSYRLSGILNREVGYVLPNLSNLSDKYASRPALKKPTRSVARQAKEYGREEHRRIQIERGRGEPVI